jgi:prepilin-type processing-associated H-X9-DG protein
LPYIEQTTVYDMFDIKTDPFVAYSATPSGNAFKTATGCLLHKLSKGRNYDDPLHPRGQQAAKTKIESFICPTTPISNEARDPAHGYGGIDYMVAALSDVDSRPGSATYGMRTVPAGTEEWKSQVVAPMLNCDRGGVARVTDGTSKTILWIEDAGRAHPDVASFGVFSTRLTPVSGAADPIDNSTGPNGRRAFAWADADAVSNGYSGPSNATSSRLAQLNNYATPEGGPAECPWSTNNCGLNDEPFSFHPGGLNVAMGDGSVRYMADSTDGVLIKWLVGADDGQLPNQEI